MDDMDLVEFVTARLDEREALALAAMPGPWIDGADIDHLVDGVVYGQSTWAGHLGQVCNVEYAHVKGPNAAHIAANDPAHVLREVAAMRAIVADYVKIKAEDDEAWRYEIPALAGARDALERVVRHVATIWDEHADYRAEWTP